MNDFTFGAASGMARQTPEARYILPTFEERPAYGRAELRQARVDTVAERLEEDLAGERVAVRMETRRGQAEEHVTLAHPAG